MIPPHVLGLYRGPFQESYLYIYDADGHTVADFRGDIDGGPRQSFRPRGWGRLQYFKDGEKLHDDAERVLLAIVANHSCDVGACLDAINDAWLRALVEKQPRTLPEKR